MKAFGCELAVQSYKRAGKQTSVAEAAVLP